MDQIVDTVKQTVSSFIQTDCSVYKATVLTLAALGALLFVIMYMYKKDESKFTERTNGTVSNVVTLSTQFENNAPETTTTGTMTFLFNGVTIAKTFSTTRSLYENDQSVDIIYNPSNGDFVIESEYTPPSNVLSHWIMSGTCVCIFCCIVLYFVLNTTWGCGIALATGFIRSAGDTFKGRT